MRHLSFTILLLLAALQLSAQQTTLTLMSYNIYHGEQAYDKGHPNLDDIAQLIRDIDPDFVALQEVDSMTQRTAKIYDNTPVDLAEALANRTGMYGYFAKAIDFSNGGYGEGLLSKHPAKMHKIDLPTPQGGEGRAMALATYTLENGGQITFGATHLCHQFDSNRVAQTDAIVNYLQGIKGAVVVAGDLNFNPTEKPYSIIGKDFIDAAADFGDPRPTIPFDDPTTRIDYIWLSKNVQWEIKEVKVIPVDFSDHMPVVVKVVLKE
ncbi:endonuclease/exonuclease/phosphatase family protein [Echinicola vietnamensis]|uniref:Metal-dependent hydrolase n=1 Tax=Echinicola vietnamensis (strain DSM 17526 / LMG 23754 / KMM 6221) TaxID=926556 RepID=L0FUT6_ECHVK|nr:endonuclease/exonuclease/phosphatase family protein [Echinicola vietnamensis]AGA76501.1 metal-dependent hydrolase [Echinicola vietnamensis DSM 17526]